MRKDINTASASKIEKRRFAVIILLVCVLLNAVNCFGIQLFYHYEVAGNVAYAAVQSVFENVIRFLNIAVLFAGYAIVCRSVMGSGFAKAFKYYAAVGITMTIPYVSGIVITKVTTAGDNLNYGLIALYSFFSLLLDIAMLLGVAVIAQIIRRAVMKNGMDPTEEPEGIFSVRIPVMLASLIISGIYSIVLIVQSVLNTVDLIKTYGSPVNFAEIMTLATPYLEQQYN